LLSQVFLLRCRTSIAFTILLLLAASDPVAAFEQNRELEAQLKRSEPQALALFPAKGYKDGAAGFFRDQHLYVVPDTERAWCQEQSRGVLKAGCYVEFFFHRRGLNARTSDGRPCGHLARWQQAPGSNSYVPTPGGTFANAIAMGHLDVLDLDFDQAPVPARLRDADQLARCAAKLGQQ
jgi:hypothetical protein